VVVGLKDYDAAVAAQAAGLMRERGIVKNPEDLTRAGSGGAKDVARGFDLYVREWRQRN
jgi:hypothetical protein